VVIVNRRLASIGILLLMTGSFLAGAWISYRTSGHDRASGGRKILYYIDPMHPSYRSDKPGIAPDCGMQLEPIYADGAAGGGISSGQLLPGTVQVSPEQMQTIGVKVAAVEQSGGNQVLRVPGRVVPDERRVYRLTAAVDGWVQSIGTATTGDMVKKNETLLSFYAPDFLPAIQAYVYAVGSLDHDLALQRKTPPALLDVNNSNLQTYRNALRNLGMSELQMDEMARSRKPSESIKLVSPAAGIIQARNVSDGLKFDKGTEFYRIADLSRVWVLADTYGGEADQIKPGSGVTVSIPNRNRTYAARVSAVAPYFDPASRTLKVRLELDNPGYILRPDMFVDVELPLRMPAMLSIPAEALLDSGLKKSVFVEKSSGIFEPREVETGRSFGNRIEIVSGLKAGERIVVSGTFLIDSESRMKIAAAGISGTPHLDPSCNMYVDEGKARAAGNFVESGGVTSYFCSDECKQKFLKKPAAKSAQPPPPATDSTPSGNSHSGMPKAAAMPAMEHKHD